LDLPLDINAYTILIPWGAAMGALISGYCCKYGRRISLIIVDLISIISVILLIISV